MTMTETQTIPHITVDNTAYAIDSLSDRAKVLVSDLFRTVKEYQGLFASYRQSVTLTNTYSGGLKTEVEKADLPVLWPYESESEKDKPTITIEDKRYDASDLPNEVKAYVAELVRANQQKTQIEFRLRQLDAARNAYIGALKTEIESSEVAPMDPQPEAAETK